MKNEGMSAAEFHLLSSQVAAALASSQALQPGDVECVAPEWKPGRVGVLLRFRSEAAAWAAYEALELAGLPSEKTTDGWRERIVLGEAEARVRGWTVGARGAGGGAHTKEAHAEEMASASADRKVWLLAETKSPGVRS